MNGLHDSSLNTVILNDNSTINLKCKTNSSIIKTTFQQESISNEIEIKCNNEMRSLNTEFEFKCLDVCNVNYLLNLMRNEDNIGKFYPINPLNQFYLTHESIRFYCNSLEYDRKVILFECLNSNWYFATKNEALNNNKQLINECAYDNEESAPATTITSTNEFYFKKNFKSLLNLKLNLKLFLVILLITSSLIILFLMLLLGITFYKRYRLNNYYRSLFTTSSHNNDRFSFLNSLFRRHDQRQLQGQENFRRGYDDQLTIGSSSSLNNNNLINQNISLPTYDEAINKPTHQQFESIETSTTGVVAAAAIISPQSSPPPSFSTILKETCSNVQSRNDDSQSNYSSISAAIPHNKKIKQLRFGSINSHHYLNDSNENFSLNGASSSIAASAITTSEVCTIITNDSTESKFVLRGSFENNIDQTSLFNYSTSLSNAILNSNNQEGKFFNSFDYYF